MQTFSGSSVLQLTDLLTSLQSWEFPICEFFPGKICSFLLFFAFFLYMLSKLLQLKSTIDNQNWLKIISFLLCFAFLSFLETYLCFYFALFCFFLLFFCVFLLCFAFFCFFLRFSSFFSFFFFFFLVFLFFFAFCCFFAFFCFFVWGGGCLFRIFSLVGAFCLQKFDFKCRAAVRSFAMDNF